MKTKDNHTRQNKAVASNNHALGKVNKSGRSQRTNPGEIFQKERKKQMALALKIINPSIHYDKEYDILYLWFGGKMKVESAIEITNDLRVDISKKGNIVAIEICNFSEYQRRNSFQ